MKRSLDNIAREATFAPSTLDPTARTVEVVFTTGASGVRYGWDEDYIEQLDVTPEAVDLTRLNSGAPVMDNHSWYSNASKTPGVVERAWVENGEGRAVLRFDTDEHGEALFGKVARGIITKVSVGYRVNEYERIPPAAKGELAVYIARSWQPFEISMVTVPFDNGAGVRNLNGAAPQTTPQPEARQMTDKTETTPTPAPDAEKIRAEALAAERARVTELTEICTAHGLPLARYIEDGATPDKARADALAAVVARQQETQVQPGANVRMGHDPQPMKRAIEAAEVAVLNRADARGVKLTDDATEFRGYTMLEMARWFLDKAGQNVRGLGPMEMLARAFTTSDLPILLANVMGKSLRQGYDAVSRDFERVFRRTTLNDFKLHNSILFSGASAFGKVNEHGEFPYGQMAESKEAYKLETYGEIIAYTRQAMINDDLAGLTRVPAALGRAAAILENETIWGLLAANPVMSDGVAVFNSAHGNQSASAGAISATTVGAAVAAMRAQTGLDGKKIAVRPAFMIVSADKQVEAEQYLNATTVPTKPSDVTPPSHRSLELVSTEWLSGNPWYLAGGPNSDSIEYAYLSGQEGLYTESRNGFNVDAVEIKARLDLGAQVIDHRTLYRNS
jgi:hypothetical protein